ncbi:MAG: ribosome-associated translation inhibitor RaiA [Polyangiales bacterium]|jgi:ribosome-associated translation inhibitor RaiA
MQIQINTDKNVEGREDLMTEVDARVRRSLSHYSSHVTRVEVHLSDENGDKSGQHDKRCMMEARFEGRRPTAVTCEAATMPQAVAGAADKLKSSLTSLLDRLHEHR